MQTLHISRQELHTRGGVLDRMLDSLFDTAILVDTDCRILYISASSFPDPSQRAAVVGQHISVLDQLSPCLLYTSRSQGDGAALRVVAHAVVHQVKMCIRDSFCSTTWQWWTPLCSLSAWR